MCRGGSWRYDVVMPGFKYNMTDIQASLGIWQLRKLERFQRRRREIDPTVAVLRECAESLRKGDGTYTYFLPDIAYHRDKAARGFDVVIDVWGADHHGYVSRVKGALAALGERYDALVLPSLSTASTCVTLTPSGRAVATTG